MAGWVREGNEGAVARGPDAIGPFHAEEFVGDDAIPLVPEAGGVAKRADRGIGCVSDGGDDGGGVEDIADCR